MTSTITRQATIKKIANTYYEVIGDTGSIYHYDAWTDSCNCLAGQHGKDCYHAANVRQFIAAEKEHQQMMEKEYSHSIRGADIKNLALNLGLEAEFTPGVTDFDGDKPEVNAIIAGKRVYFTHLGEEMATILFNYTEYAVLNRNGKIHTNFETTVEQLRTDLTRLLKYKIKQDKESLFDCWGVSSGDDKDYPERPRIK
ncbi:MAG: hypothetical protein ACKPE3_07080 [Sphaerospermopsis kisseleviana]